MAGTSFRRALLGASILAGTIAVPVSAQTAPAGAPPEDDAIIVTATRRETTLQDAPINISAIGAETLSRQRIDDVRGLAAFTPGLTITDTGPGSTGNVILRGISSADTQLGTNAQSALGIYLGEVPLYLDFKLIDLARVEVLQGPQGTLYGLGTLSGAIRYMPNRPNTDRISLEYHGRYFGVAHGSSPGVNGDATFNLPIVTDHIAFRTATGYYDNPGFIDYPYLLQQPGVSNPQPVRGDTAAQGSFGTPADYAANFYRRKDLNYERTFTTRNQLLLQASPGAKLFLTYAHQTTDTGGQQANGAGVLGTGRYEAPWRYAEPRSRKADLYAAEFNLGLGGIADLVATAALTNQRNRASSDNTDLLLDLDYGYEAFPAFSSYNTNETLYRQFNGEVRLVSTHGGPFSWVIGGFYNNQRQRSQYREYTPGYNAFGLTPDPTPEEPNRTTVPGIRFRPDDLEYMSFVNTRTKEKAIYGEGTVHITDAWQVTGGLRYYKYDAFAEGGTDTPLFSSRTPYPLVVFAPSRIRSGNTAADGFVWKANTSYKFSDALLVYGTYSTGYRTGNVNRVAPCPPVLDPGQNVCALPNELAYQPDRTRNAEIGVRSSLFDRRLQLTASAYRILWNGIQVPSQTVNGAVGITVNGSKARSQGFDVSALLKVTPQLSLQGTYSYVDAKLTQDAPNILVSQGELFSAFAGDRLPGSAKHTASAQATYTYPLASGADVEATWATAYIGDIYSRVGLRANGEVIPGYVTHRAAITYRTDRFDIGVFGDNLFDKYAITSISNDRSSFNQTRTGVIERYYAQGVLTPRRIGVDFRVRY
ncbi:MAG: TonB-dependent receptor [Sphingomonas adhaesiva]|uniref:TonB-dependent receptor n=1 Tax=Sphingomonas adhaesiva TaxID=28212 RepID=UPI002FF933AF